MKMYCLSLALLTLAGTSNANASNWPHGAGPNFNFQVSESAPVTWSVVNDKNIFWKVTKPETGQGIPVVHDGKVFFSTMKEVSGDAKLGKDTVAWCCDANTGKTLWQRTIVGGHFSRLSGCFTDSSAPPASIAGNTVIFMNPSGTITCFDFDGNVVWSKEQLSVGQTLPVVHGGNYIYIRQIYRPDNKGVFPGEREDNSRSAWTQLEALDAKTGEPVWSSTCGVNMKNFITLQQLRSGNKVIVCGRGGGHNPPETPEGISLVDADDGETLWSLPLEGFTSTQTLSIRNDLVHLIHKKEHLSVDALTGRVVKRIDLANDVPVRRMINGQRQTLTESVTNTKSSRMFSQGSNLLVGQYHYFRSYTAPYLGRVNVDTGKVEYLELPLQMKREPGKEDQFKWFNPKARSRTKQKKLVPINYQYFVPNELKNSRGFTVFDDYRSRGNGWGHVASAIPSVAGDHLYIPIMSGTVYVIKWKSDHLDENSIAAINDLGPVGKSFTRASLTFSNGRIYAHTIRELICIGQ